MILHAGIMLQDRYEILEKIGSGGMSEVYKAKCHKLNRLVAIKVLKAEFTSDAGFVSKFKMEAQAAAGLSHPNIVNIYDVVDDGDLHFIVMELVEGITLKSYITKKGHLDVKETIGIAIQVAQGIEAAHEQHIIHRDIKPQNMLISMDGKVKVADFGIARAVSSQTMNSTVVGTVHYISPEQARGGFSDERSDLYSLGITMFEMVTGRVPFDGDNTVTVALAHLEEPIPLPSFYNPEVTPSLERIIVKCTEKRPENRYSNAGELIGDLRRALLNPDDPAIGQEEPAHPDLSETRPMSQKELDIIKGRSRELEEMSRNGRASSGEANREGADRKTGKTGVRRPGKGRREQDGNAPATGVEKMVTTIGVAAAIIVVAGVVFLFSQIGGMLRPSSSETESETTSAEATTAESESSEETSLSQKEVLMPSLEGKTQEEAEAELEELDLVMQVEQQASDDVEEGVVISHENEPGTVVPRFSKVRVTISSGSDQIDLASLGLTDMTLETAVRLLEGRGFKTTVMEEASETEESGNIIRVEPADKAPYGATITLYVSTGPAVEMVPVPNLEGKTQDEATDLLVEAGLVTGQTSEEHSDTVPAGQIIRQGIAADTEVEVGSTVDYVLSLGPEAPQTQFLASLETTYPLMVSYGPGAGSSEIQIMIRLKQTVNGQVVYTKLTEPRSYSADTMLEIRLDNIRGADGVSTGEVEIVDLTNNVVLTSYNVTFTETVV